MTTPGALTGGGCICLGVLAPLQPVTPAAWNKQHAKHCQEALPSIAVAAQTQREQSGGGARCFCAARLLIVTKLAHHDDAMHHYGSS